MLPYVIFFSLFILGCSTKLMEPKILLDPFETTKELAANSQAAVKVHFDGETFNAFFLYNERFLASDYRLKEACRDVKCRITIEYDYEMRRYPKALEVELEHLSTLATSRLSIFKLIAPIKSPFKHLILGEEAELSYSLGHPLGALKKLIKLDSKTTWIDYDLENMDFSALLNHQGRLIGWVDRSELNPSHTWFSLRYFSNWPLISCLLEERKVCYPNPSNSTSRSYPPPEPQEDILPKEEDLQLDLNPDIAWKYLNSGKTKFRQVDLIKYFIEYKTIDNYRSYAVSIAKAYMFFLDPKAIIARSFLNDPLVSLKAKLEIEDLLYRNYSL